MEDNTLEQAATRQQAIIRVEREFIGKAISTVKQIVMLDDDGPRELPKFLQCYRVDNIFFRVLPDSRSGRNYVASLRGVLQSRTRLLTVPLSCMFFYRGMPVLAQALVPMPRQPTRLYGADSTNDQEVEAEILHMAEALNIPFPDGTLEVYAGLDGRFYLTNSNSTLTPLFLDDTIMKRQEMLRLCDNVLDGHDDTLAVLKRVEVLNSVVESCMDSETHTTMDRLKKMCDILHSFGINMCLLKQVIKQITEVGTFDGATIRKVSELIFVEMLARSVKQEFYLEVQGKRVAYDDDVLNATLSKHMAAAFASVDLFQSRFLEVVARKYGVVDQDDDIIMGLTTVRESRKADIVARVCALVGVTIDKSSSNSPKMRWHLTLNASVLPRLIDPKQVRVLAEKYRNIITQNGHRYAFCFPIRWKVACWEGHYDTALDLVQETAMAQRKSCGENAIVPLYSKWNVCEVCFATMQRNSIAEGRSLFPGVMRGFEDMTCLMTQGRRHIEYGFWLLRVAPVYQLDDLVTYRSCVEEAVHHFYRAIEKLPAYLKSEHGSWLHLQPYKGLLQCKRLLPSCSVNTKELVERSIELSSIGWASDFFMTYLWKLALQLGDEGRHEDAIRVILTAITVNKKTPTVSFDLPMLMMDAAQLYRSWDHDKYSEHCLTMMREAVEKAGELFGVSSREYACVLNNKGAVEIDLNRLSDAGDTLKKAEVAFEAAGVSKDDLEFKAFLENLVRLEQRLAAQPVERRGFLQRYPFLANLAEGFPFMHIRPLEDAIFVGLAHQRAHIASETPDAKHLEKKMKERLWELLRFIQEGDILKRYPFLPAMINDIPTASLRLDDDALFEEFARPLQGSRNNSEVIELERRLRDYVFKKARDTAFLWAYMERREDEFNEAHGKYVNLMLPIPWLYVLEDERFNVLTDQLQGFVNTQASASKIEEIQEKMARRVVDMEDETFRWRGELAHWLSPSKLYSVPLRDLIDDRHLLDLICMGRWSTSGDDISVESINILIRSKIASLWERASITRLCLAVDDEDIHREFPFLMEMPHHQRLSTLMLYEDPTVLSLVARLRRRQSDSRLQTELAGAVKAIAARQRDARELKKWYYDIDRVVSGAITLQSAPKVRDEYYMQLWQERNIVQAQYAEKSPQMVKLMHQMEHRILQMNSWMRKVRAHECRRRLHLEAKYPFVSHRHEGYTLDALGIEEDKKFMSIVEQRRLLLTSPNVSSADIDRLSHQAEKRVAKIASHRVKQSEHISKDYPFILSRMEGVETATMHLEENEIFKQKAACYRQLSESDSYEIEVRSRRLVREMQNIALATAREIGVRKWREAIENEDLLERYPFLPEEPARGVLLGDVCPVRQPEFRTLSNRLDELRLDPPRNATDIRAVEEQMTALVVRLAEERASATEKAHEQYPFLSRRVLGVDLGELPLHEDELFVSALKEGVSGKESLLHSRVVQLAECHNLNETQLADNDDAVLSQHPYLIYTSRKCFPLRYLPLKEDILFNEKLREYEELIQQISVDEDAAVAARTALVRRADELALNEIEKIERIKQTFESLQPLTLEDLRHLQDNRTFQEYGDDAAETVPSVLLEDAKRSLLDSRKDRAARVQEVDALRKTYPMLGRQIDPDIFEDPTISKLVSNHDELLNDVEKNAGKLLQIEEEILRQASELKTEIKGDQATVQKSRDSAETSSIESLFHEIEDDILDDPYYQELTTEYNIVEARQQPQDKPLLRRLQAQISERKKQIERYIHYQSLQERKSKHRVAERYPFLKQYQYGIAIATLRLEDDEVMRQLERERESNLLINPETTTGIEEHMKKRARAMAKELFEEKKVLTAALPFLGHTVKGIPLRELTLMSDPTFAELTSQYAQVVSLGDAAERLRLEQELQGQAGRIARGVRVARQRDAVRNEDLLERYPFLPEEPARGVLLGDVCPVRQPEFRTLSNRLDELRLDPPRNATDIRAVEEQMTALVVRLAEERASATEKAHEQYPFLSRRVLGVDLGELPLHEDDTFLQLARRRMRQLKHPATANEARGTEEEMVKRAEELARGVRLVEAYRADGNEYVRARNPFLVYEDRKCVFLSEIPLVGDSEYQKLFRDRLDALEDVAANGPRIVDLEEALRFRADELALAKCEGDLKLMGYPFLAFDSVPGWSDEMLRDAEFQQLCARYDELSKDPQGNANALRELEDAMNARGEAVARALREAEAGEAAEQDRLRVLHPTDPGVSPSVQCDAEQEASMGQPEEAYNDAEGGTIAVVTGDRERSLFSPSAPGEEQPTSGVDEVPYAFLPMVINGVTLSELYLEDDPYFQELYVRYKEFVPLGTEPTVPLARQLHEQLYARAEQLASDTQKVCAANKRAAARIGARYPYLDATLVGVSVWATSVEADNEFRKILHDHEELIASELVSKDEGSLHDIETALNARARAVAENMLNEEKALAAALPFLGHTVKGIPLRELTLMSDPTFAELTSQYAQVVSLGDAAERLRLEQELQGQAGRIARGVRVARQRDAVRNEDLLERYPFLPEEPARGVLLGDVCPVRQPEFRTLSNRLDELRLDPPRNATDIRAVEEQMTALVVRLAEERASATEKAHEQYPFLSRRVLGVDLGELPLHEDDTFLQLARRRMRQLKHPATANEARGTEEEMVKRAEELARGVRLVEAYRADGNEYVRARNPFLVYEDRKCVFLSEIPLVGDSEYQKLFRDRLDALEDVAANGPRIVDLEEALRFRADELALAKCEGDLKLMGYPFLAFDSVPGWSDEMLRDAEFQQLCARYDELSKDPQGNANALRELEDAMNARGEAVARALREAEAGEAAEQDRLRVLHPTDPGVSPSVQCDAEQEASMGQPEEAYNDAEGGTIAVVTGDRERSLFSPSAPGEEQPTSGVDEVPYAFLPMVINGVTLSELYLEDDPYFQELYVRYKEFVPLGTEPTVPLARQLHEQLYARAEQLASDTQKVCAANKRAAARIGARYPYLDATLVGVSVWATSVEADNEFRKILHDHEELIASELVSKDEGSLHDIETALNARARAVAENMLNEEKALAAALPFLGHTVKGIPLRELTLMSDPTFAELTSQYAQVVSLGDAAERLRLEQELQGQAGRIARGVRVARQRDAVRNEDLLERYPFLPEEPARGVLLGDVCPVRQPEFRTLSNRLDELRLDPPRNATDIRAVEEQMTALVVRLAEERASATEKAHEQYPFLSRRVLGVDLGELPLHEDDTFLQLARRRMRQLKHPATANEARGTEEEMVKRAEELARGVRLVEAYRADGNEYVRARNPFLVYEDRKCVFLSEIPLVGDSEYQKLFRDRLDALEDVAANGPRIVDLEEALRFRADELALAKCEGDLKLMGYPFLAFDSVPGWSDEMLRDAEFQQLCARYDELSKDPQGNANALRELEDAMNARGEAVARALREAEAGEAAEQDRLRVLHPTDPGVSPSVQCDAEQEASMGQPEEAYNDAEGGTIAVVTGDRERSLFSPSAPGEEQPTSGVDEVPYAFLPMVINGVTLSELYLEDDPYFQELYVRYKEFVPLGTEPTVPLARQLHEQLYARAEQLASDTQKVCAANKRAAARIGARYPYLDATLVGVSVWATSVEADNEFRKILHDHEELIASELVSKDEGSLHDIETALNARARAVAENMLNEEKALAAALPFLGHTVKGIPLRELTLMSDPTFAELTSQYAQVVSLGDAAERLRLEQELQGQAGRIARGVRVARQRDAVRNEDLLERYPFLPEEPARGVLLGDVCPVRQPEFRTLSNRLDELRLDPPRNATDIRAVEEQMTALVVRLAEERASATEKAHEQYPFLSRRVLGVDLGELPLHEDDTFLQLARRRMRQLKHPATANEARGTEEEMVKRAEELARGVRLVEAYRADGNEYVRARNPFLVYEDRKCVFLSEIPLVGDSEYQKLFRDRLDALEDVAANGPRIVDLEEALRFRADELALAKCEGDLKLMGYPFLAFDSVPGWSDEMLRDAEFQQLCARYDELSKDPQGNANALRELEDAMNARGEAVARALREAEAGEAAEQDRLRVLYPMCPNLPLTVEADAQFMKLVDHKTSLLGEGAINSTKDAELADKSIMRRVSLLSLSYEENAIEMFQESEVISFVVRMKRTVKKRRRARGSNSLKRSPGMELDDSPGDKEQDDVDGLHLGSERSEIFSLTGVDGVGYEGAVKNQQVEELGERLQSLENAEERERACIADEESKERDNVCILAEEGEDAVRNQQVEELGERLQSLENAEERERACIADEESKERDNICILAEEGEGAVRNQQVEELGERLQSLENAEERERACIADEESKERDNICILAEEGEGAVRNQVLNRLGESLQIVPNAEKKERDCITDEETKECDNIFLAAEEEEIALRKRLLSELMGRLQSLENVEEQERACITDEESKDRDNVCLAAEEEEACSLIQSDERRSFEDLLENFRKLLRKAVYAQEERKAFEEAEKRERRQAAQTMIQSVIFAYRIRRRLADRFINRKAQEHKNALADIFSAEFAARNVIGDDERLERQEIDEAQRSLLAIAQKASINMLAALEKEEDDARHQLIDDSLFQLSQVQRASRKILAKQQDSFSLLKKLQEFEETQDKIRHTAVSPISNAMETTPLSERSAEVEEEEGDEEDFDAPLVLGKYKGYALDSIGIFLLQYERDLRRFKASLEKNRQAVATEHDLLKKSRDTATQDMVHGGTGALWIPSRPLPLSDLVRGPSAQYRRGRIVDARGQRLSARMMDFEGRTMTPSDGFSL